MRPLERLLTVLITGLFGMMVVLVTLQVVNRYGLRMSVPWTEELTRLCYVLLIFIGSALAVLRSGHIRVESIIRLLHPKAYRWIAIVSDLVSAAFFGIVAYGASLYAQLNMGARFPTSSWLSVGMVMAIVAVAAALTAFLFLWRTVIGNKPRTADDSGVSQ